MTSKLFPSEKRQEEIIVTSTLGSFTTIATMIDVANPFVFIDAATMPLAWHSLDRNDPAALELVEEIRCVAAVKMGLAKNEASAHLVRGTPKIAVVSPVNSPGGILENGKGPADIYVTSYSMGKLHPSFQLTGAVCLGAACCIPGTVASDITKRQAFNTPPGTPPGASRDQVLELELGGKIEQSVKLQHVSGDIEAYVTLKEDAAGEVVVENVAVSRTARRLFEGNVLISI